MKIGYACISIGVPNTEKHTCKLNNATEERLLEIIKSNLDALENTINYNIENKIYLFRIGSDLIPFGSSPVNNLSWWEIFKDKFESIGKKIITNKIRVSMHPGQYTVLNSPNPEIVERAIADLEYHNRILDALGVDSKSKMVIHIGGIYNDKSKAIEVFIKNYQKLTESIKRRLIIENDDKLYTITDVLEISRKTKIPVVYDNLHNSINPSDAGKSDSFWIELCSKTWDKKDGVPKVHYSQQDPSKRNGSHSKTIILDKFLSYYNSIKGIDLEIMLEVKDKNLSAIKCINSINKYPLEREWDIYKYLVLEHSLELYKLINELFKSKEIIHQSFYNHIEEALETETKKDNTIIAINLIWNILKNKVQEKEKKRFVNLLSRFKKDQVSEKAIKNYLLKLASHYNSFLKYNLFFYSF
jgi:UV DNA damage endonuclease